ncbi:MAG: acyltransferase [Acidimicrobiales bacterium]|nr:acyltransferase [Acidimicrobiales bacterium]
MGTTIDLDLRATPLSRNRAVDAYRAAAMCAVAVGHWLAAAVVRNDGGDLEGINALSRVPSLHWLTLLFQVMPLFFCLGGYSNAASLDAHRRHGGTDSVWVAARLRRLGTPAAALAGTWTVLLAASVATGIGPSMVAAAAAVAAIPLWFLANYVVDTAVAPRTLSWHRRNPRRLLAGLAAAFLTLEGTRLLGIAHLAEANIVLGWMLFQVLGFWWRDGLLPAPRRLLGIAAAAAATCAALVAVGPWPLAMVNVPGVELSNTWPPSLALVAYGVATTLLAVAAAGPVNAVLPRPFGVWQLVAGANTITMTVYLWHFSAMAAVGGVWAATGWLSDAPVGSAAWWSAKVPMLAAALVVLTGMAAVFGRFEREGLLGGRDSAAAPLPAGAVAAITVALGGGFELWTLAAGNPALTAAGMACVLGAHRALRLEARRPRAAAARRSSALQPVGQPAR